MIDDLQDIKLGWLTGKIEQFAIARSDSRFMKKSSYKNGKT